MDPDQNVTIVSPLPLNPVDTAHVHLYSHPTNDSVWYRERFELERINDETYRLKAEWRPGTEYSLGVIWCKLLYSICLARLRSVS